MKTLKVLLQEVVSGIKAWVNSNFAQESNAVHKTGDETINGVKTFTKKGIFNVSDDDPIKLVNSQDATNPGSTVMKDLRFYDVNDKIIGGVRHSLVPDGTSKIHLYSRSFSSDGSSNSNHGLLVVNNRQTGVHEVQSESSFIPAASNSYNLGTSTYQWNNAYAKTYYAEGVKVKSPSQEVGVIPTNSVIQTIEFRDKNDSQHGYIGLWDYSAGASEIQFNITDKFKDGAKDPTGTASSAFLSFGFKSNSDHFITFSGKVDNSIIPLSNNLYNLGSSTNQWWTISSRYYYYNGTAWGLDKANTWTGNNRFQALTISSTNTIDITQSTLPSATTSANFSFNDNGGRYWGAIRTQVQTDRSNILKFVVSNWKTNGTQGITELDFFYDANLDKKSFYPTGVNVDLGTSANKWKTLNGLNPGALSLPKGYTEEGADKDYIDIKSVIQTLDNTEYYYTLPDNGWICVRAEQAKRVHITLKVGWFFGQSICSSVDATLIASAPFRKGDQITLKVEAITLQEARFYPMQGNV